MTSTVFISYRRNDAKWAASAIHSELCKHLGNDKVFKDVDSIALGRPWRVALEDALDKCEATLVLIGDKWLDGGPDGRLHQDGDLVREEIAVSLARAIPVVPVTLDDTALPKPTDLPDDIVELIEMQGISVSHETYKREVESLVMLLGLRRTGDGAIKAGAPPPDLDGGLREGLVKFLSDYGQWSFSPLRIAKWGARQDGFSFLSKYSSGEIGAELKSMVADGVAETRTSKKGGTLYRLRR